MNIATDLPNKYEKERVKMGFGSALKIAGLVGSIVSSAASIVNDGKEIPKTIKGSNSSKTSKKK